VLSGRQNVRRLHFRCVPIAVQSIAMPCSISVSVCKCISVSEYQCREKKEFPDRCCPRNSERSRTQPFLGGVKSTLQGSGEVGKAEAIADRRGHAPTTNKSSGSIRNDYHWLRERGVCTRPALGIYIETNPISHYVRSFKFTSKFSVYACDIKVYLHTT